MTIYQLANQIADLVEKRSKNGFNFGVLLLPEGILELLEDIHTLVIISFEVVSNFISLKSLSNIFC